MFLLYVFTILKQNPQSYVQHSGRERPSHVSSSTIERAEIVSEDMATSLVTIGTHDQLVDHGSHSVSDGRLAFPDDVETHAISVSSPSGSQTTVKLPFLLRQPRYEKDARDDHRVSFITLNTSLAGPTLSTVSSRRSPVLVWNEIV